MTNRNSKSITLLICLQIFAINCIAQENHGYLIRGYNSRSLKVDESNISPLFFGFLCKKDLGKLSNDSIVYDSTLENSRFSLQISKLFDNQVHLIEETPSNKDFQNNNCIVLKPVDLGDVKFYDFSYYYRVNNEYYYILFVNSVTIDFCHLKQYTDFDFNFKSKISLKSLPNFSKLNNFEAESLKNCFQRMKSVFGSVLFW